MQYTMLGENPVFGEGDIDWCKSKLGVNEIPGYYSPFHSLKIVMIYTQRSTLRRARMHGACRSRLRANKLVATCPTGQVIFQSRHVLIFPAVYRTFTGLVQILAGHVKIFARHVNFHNYLPDVHVNQMLNVMPWHCMICARYSFARCKYYWILVMRSKILSFFTEKLIDICFCEKQM